MTDFGGSSTDQAFGIALQRDGKIIAAGVSGNDFAIARLNADDLELVSERHSGCRKG